MCGGWKKRKKGPKSEALLMRNKSEESSTAHSHWPQLASQMPIAICLIVQVPSPRNASPLHYIFSYSLLAHLIFARQHVLLIAPPPWRDG